MNYNDLTKEELIHKLDMVDARYYKLKELLKLEGFAKTAILHNMSELLIYHSRDMRILWVNKAAAESVNLSPEQMLGRYCYEVWNKIDSPCINCPVLKALETGETQEAEMSTLAGKTWLVRGNPVRDNDNNVRGVVEITLDITERKKAKEEMKEAYRKLKETQQELIQSSKMVAMGQLAAGISHELNQPLTGIKGFAQAGLMDLPAFSPVKPDLERIIKEADRMYSIIKGIRFFARKSKFEVKKVDINKPIRDSLSLLEDQLRINNIKLEKTIDEDLPPLYGDENQLEQVFLNLITNAKDAIDMGSGHSGGTVKVETSLSSNKKNIVVKFEDSGCGISQKDIDHIFNPFFTTKSPDGGMGLGLSIVYRIIESHKGRIEVESQEGKGTSFSITLPAARVETTQIFVHS